MKSCNTHDCVARVSSVDERCAIHATGSSAPERASVIGTKERPLLAFARGVVELLEDGAPCEDIRRLAERFGLLPRRESNDRSDV